MDYEKKIEIPFGAKDSELGGFEYTIPQGYEAEIKDGKVIVRIVESEDEKIRSSLLKYLKDMCKNTRTPFSLDNAKLWIDWLEKQGEQKEHDVCDNCDQQGSCVSPCPMKLVKKHDEQKETLCDKCRQEQPSHSCQDITELGRCALEKQGEQKPAKWSEEDEAIYYGVIETEQYMLDVVNGIKKFNVGNISIKEECTRELNWLKNRLKSIRPQPTWKPSEQDILLLERIANGLSNPQDFQASLGSLIGQLKKLREE